MDNVLIFFIFFCEKTMPLLICVSALQARPTRIINGEGTKKWLSVLAVTETNIFCPRHRFSSLNSLFCCTVCHNTSFFCHTSTIEGRPKVFTREGGDVDSL